MPSTTKQIQSQQTTIGEGLLFGHIFLTGHFTQNGFFSTNTNQNGPKNNAVASMSRGIRGGMLSNGMHVHQMSYVVCGCICIPLLSVLSMTQILLTEKKHSTNRAFVRENETSRI